MSIDASDNYRWRIIDGTETEFFITYAAACQRTRRVKRGEPPLVIEEHTASGWQVCVARPFTRSGGITYPPQ